MTSAKLLKRALFIGAAIACCTLAGFILLPTDIAPYVALPGMFVAVYVAAVLSAAIHGNAHGADWTVIAIVSTIVNFPLYVGAAFVVLRAGFHHPREM